MMEYSPRAEFTDSPAVLRARLSFEERYARLCENRPYLRGHEAEPKRYALVAEVPDRCFSQSYSKVQTAALLHELGPAVMAALEDEAYTIQVVDLWTGFEYDAHPRVEFTLKEAS